MLAMQYSVRLPMGCDVEEASRRVEQRRGLFEGLNDLVHKTYLFDQEERLYAPIYLWRSQEAAQKFLFDGLFDDVVATYGRPRVRSWHMLDFDHGPCTEKPSFACYESDRVDTNQPLADVLSREREEQARSLENPALYARLTALDVDRWELARFSLWAEKDAISHVTADCVQIYNILDVCEGENQERRN